MTTPASTTAALSWPPPGLEPIHGRLWPAIAVLAFGNLVLVPPLLLSLGAQGPIGSLGPLGSAFWVLLLTTLLGVIVLLSGLSRLHRMLRGARAAAAAGHARRTILAVMADGTHDTGFLLTGSRSYASLGPTERDTILAARLVAAVLSLAAVLLMPGGLGLAVLLGRSRLGGEALLWTLSLWGPLVLGLGAVFTAFGARALAASARRKRAAQPAGQVREEVAAWNQTLNALRPDRAPRPAPAARPLLFRLGGWGVVLLAVLVFFPVMGLVVRGTIGAALASLAVPGGKTRARFAAAETLRRFELPPDTTVSPREGGEALQALVWVGRKDAERQAPEQRPVRAYAEPWFPPGPGPIAVLGTAWMDSLFSVPRYAAAHREFLRRVAAHPAQAEFARLARARDLDVTETRYDLPFGPSVTIVNLPMPRFAGLRDGARAHLALAAVELMNGRPARAEEVVREVISAGFRLLDDGPNLIDNLVGVALIDLGGEALERVQRATGRSRDADALRWAWTSARQAAERTAAGEARLERGDVLPLMAHLVLDKTQARGMRWDFLGWTAVFAPCASIRAAAFGPGEDYARWLESARQALVRRPGDEALFQLSLKGPFGSGRCMPLWSGLRTIGQMR